MDIHRYSPARAPADAWCLYGSPSPPQEEEEKGRGKRRKAKKAKQVVDGGRPQMRPFYRKVEQFMTKKRERQLPRASVVPPMV